ncbi:hypothetical protein [Aquimarina longa]|uniref:hypothetical protein n=1 Tax=Aquimarina longa TaxID=1080221 RepID=UPI0007849E45|nr:hypothetical protein [Aquimarina longa]
MQLEHKEIRPNIDEKKNQTTINQVQNYLDEHYELRINVLTMELEYKAIKQVRFKTLDDRQLNTIWMDIQNEGIKCTDSTLMKILNSNYTKSYHPIKDYFNNLPKPDDKDYIKELADTICISDIEIDDIRLSDLWYDYLKKWLVASGIRMSSKRLSQAMERLKYGQPISKRIKNKGARKVYPVRLVSDEMEKTLQKEFRDMHKITSISKPDTDLELPL